MSFNNVANRFASVDRGTVRSIYNLAIQDAYLELREIASSLGKTRTHDMLTIDTVADRVKHLQAKSAAPPEAALPGDRVTLELFGNRLEYARKLARLYADATGLEYDMERAIESAILNEVERLKRE
jgi:hypothetical protein